MTFLPPTSFSEGQRQLYGWMMIGAGIFCGAMAVVMVLIFVWGGWPATRYEQILTILGVGFGGFLAGMMIVMVALAVGGPVGRFKGGVTKGGLDFEVSGDGVPVAEAAKEVAGAAVDKAKEIVEEQKP